MNIKTFLKYLQGDLYGGFISSLIALPLTLACGLLLFKGILGYEELGITAALYSAILGSFLGAFRGNHSLQVSGPRVVSTIILADYLFTVYSSYTFTLSDTMLQQVLFTIMFLCVFFSGLIQYLFAVLKLGKLIKFLPTSVTLGVSFTIALIIISKQFSVVFSYEKNGFSLDKFFSFEGLVVFFTMLFIVSFLFLNEKIKKIYETKEHFIKNILLLNAVLIPLVITFVFFWLLPNNQHLLLGEVSFSLPSFIFYTEDFSFLKKILFENLSNVLLTSLAIALMGSLNSLLSVSILETKQVVTNHDTSIELKSQGFGNMILSMFGAMSSSGSEARGLSNYNAGGRTRFSVFVHSFSLFIMIFMCYNYLAYIPNVVLSAFLIQLALIMALPLILMAKRMCLSCLQKKDKDISSCIKDIIQTFGVVFVMLFTAYFKDVSLAIVAGFTFASLLFIYEMMKNSNVEVLSATNYQSRKLRNKNELICLKEGSSLIKIIELEGAIFFGTADSLRIKINEIEDNFKWIILDFRRVTEVDITGAQIISLCKKDKKNVSFNFSHVRKDDDTYQALCAVGLIDDENTSWFENTDIALEHCEDELLLSKNISSQNKNLSLKDIFLFKDLTSVELETLNTYLCLKKYAKDENLFKEEEESTHLYFLKKGHVSIVVEQYNNKKKNLQDIRRITFHPGHVLGEMAFFEERVHSVSALNKEEVEVYMLSKKDFKNLAKNESLIYQNILEKLCISFSKRLRQVSKEVQVLEEWH